MSAPAGEPPSRPLNAAWKLLAWLALALAAWLLLPPLDLYLSGLFYRPGAGFYLSRAWPVLAVYQAVPWVSRALAAALLGGLLWACAWRSPLARRSRGPLAFALLALALGPGLVGNTLLKDHWGRPRPEQIVEFGGGSHYVPVPLPSRQCPRNCSFVSGHALVGFYFIAGAWLWPRQRRRWLAAGIGAGMLIGLVRVVQGGHFFSDVLGALAVVWAVDAALYRFMAGRGWLGPRRPSLWPG